MKNVFTLFALIFSLLINAQDFYGKATYKTHRKVDIKLDSSSNGPSVEVQKQLMAQLQKQFQRTYTLNFTKTESTFKQNEKLEAPKAQAGGAQIMVMEVGGGGGTDVLYKNITEKRYANKTEISGKRFLIQDKLEDLGWKMSGETKSIGNYTCYKATRSREEERISLSVDNGEEKENKETVTVETVAWYTPDIPISNGPRRFWGLPGLILEIQEGNETIVCTEIILNPSEKIIIDEPTKGKKITQDKFEKIMDDHSKEMMERFRNRRKSKDGHNMSIEIQG